MTSDEIDELLNDATHISFVASMRWIYLIFPNQYEAENLHNILLNFFGNRELIIRLVKLQNNSIDFYLGDTEDFVSAKNLQQKTNYDNIDKVIKFEEEYMKSGLYESQEFPIEFYIVNLDFSIGKEPKINPNLHFMDQRHKRLNIKWWEVA